MLRLSAEVGGIFTDLVLIDDASNFMHSCKVSSLPGSCDVIVKAIESICARAGVEIEAIGLFLHSFMIATNAWLIRTGADGLLLVTDGYRDILEIADQRRPEFYNLATQKSLPLLDRSQVATVNERTDAFGNLVVEVTDNEAN